jgi:hypothetical protein
MDGNGKKPCGGNKTARPAPATDATQQQQPAAQAAVLETPALSDDAAAAQQVDDDQPDVASVDESRGGGGAEEEEDNRDDDEQVERFYALLANIRAMRGLAPHNMASSSCGGRGDSDDTDTDTAGAGDSTGNKRLRRSAEPPWRPAFRMEDFEEPPPPTAASCKMSTKRTRGTGHGPR